MRKQSAASNFPIIFITQYRVNLYLIMQSGVRGELSWSSSFTRRNGGFSFCADLSRASPCRRAFIVKEIEARAVPFCTSNILSRDVEERDARTRATSRSLDNPSFFEHRSRRISPRCFVSHVDHGTPSSTFFRIYTPEARS